MNLEQLHNHWIALSVRRGQEIVVGKVLAAHGFEAVIPLHVKCNSCADRCNGAPFFPGYCIVRFDAMNRWSIVRTPGVHRIVCFGGKVPCLSEQEVRNLSILARSSRCKTSHTIHAEGAPVRVASGPLTGATGVITKTGPAGRLTITTQFFNRSISVAIDEGDVIVHADSDEFKKAARIFSGRTPCVPI